MNKYLEVTVSGDFDDGKDTIFDALEQGSAVGKVSLRSHDELRSDLDVAKQLLTSALAALKDLQKANPVMDLHVVVDTLLQHAGTIGVTAESVERDSNDRLAFAVLESLAVDVPPTVALDFDYSDPRGPNYGGALVTVALKADSGVYGTLHLVVDAGATDGQQGRWLSSVWDIVDDQKPETPIDDPSSEQGKAQLQGELAALIAKIGLQSQPSCSPQVILPGPV